MAAALVAVGSVAIWAFAHAPVDAGSLTRSVERESGSQGGIVSESSGCQTTAADIWDCEVVDSGSSGTASYHVRITEGSCWSGRLVTLTGEPMPAQISGCVLLRD